MSEPTQITTSDSAWTFARGVAAGAAALEMLSEIAHESRDTKLKFFWLSVGTKLAQDVPYGEQELVTQFVAGAATRAPTEGELGVDPRRRRGGIL